MEYEEFVKELSQLDNESYELVVKLIERLKLEIVCIVYVFMWNMI